MCYPLVARLRDPSKELYLCTFPPRSALPHERGGASSQGSGKDGSTLAASSSTSFWSPMQLYWQQPVLLPLLSLSCLHCSVLTLGFLMTGYLASPTMGLTEAEVSLAVPCSTRSIITCCSLRYDMILRRDGGVGGCCCLRYVCLQRVSPLITAHPLPPLCPMLARAQISGYRGVGALTGLASTLIFPLMGPRIGVPLTGLIGVGYQVSGCCGPEAKAPSGLQCGNGHGCAVCCALERPPDAVQGRLIWA